MREKDYLTEYERRLKHRFPRAEDQPDPTRRYKVWSETMGAWIYLSSVDNPYKIDRGEA